MRLLSCFKGLCGGVIQNSTVGRACRGGGGDGHGGVKKPGRLGGFGRGGGETEHGGVIFLSFGGLIIKIWALLLFWFFGKAFF